MKFTKKDFYRIPVLIIASLITALNINTFVNTGGLFPGGITGISVLLQRSLYQFAGMQIPFSVFNIVLNILPLYIGFRFLGKKFTLYSLIVILLSSLFTDLLPGLSITNDILLISIFGGILSAVAGSLCLYVNSCGGGLDFIVMYLNDRKHLDGWGIVFGANCIILIIAGLLFGWDKALYSIIYQYTATQTSKLLYKRYARETLFVVTNSPAQVCSVISQISKHGATIISGKGSYDQQDRSMVYSVVASSESGRVIRAIKQSDPDAFINCVQTTQLTGKFYQDSFE